MVNLMKSHFLKILAIGLLITCVTIFYGDVYVFVSEKTYGSPKPQWLNISQEDCKSCDNGKTRNCYPHPDDTQLCGKCFATCPEWKKATMLGEDRFRKKKEGEPLFAVTATMRDVNKLLVLIASIHKHYPTAQLVVFELDNSTMLVQQLISIRNVVVISGIRFRGAEKVYNKVHTVYYLQELLADNQHVIWLPHDVEIVNTKLFETPVFSKVTPYAIAYVSHDKRRVITSSGYRAYFPSSRSMKSTLPLVVLLKEEAKGMLKWVEQCALTPDCWKCDTASGGSEDCTWMVLQTIARDRKKFTFFVDINGSVEPQSWGPPECDFYCALYMVGITVAVVVGFAALALVLYRKATTREKTT